MKPPVGNPGPHSARTRSAARCDRRFRAERLIPLRRHPLRRGRGIIAALRPRGVAGIEDRGISGVCQRRGVATAMQSIPLRVNGRPVEVAADGDTPLLDVLRNRLGLTGTKFGCGLEQCGSCMVLIDGKPEKSCGKALSTMTGKEIVTIEGLGTPDQPHPLQQAFLDEQAGQCGDRLPGILISAKALLDQNPAPSRARIAQALDDNICRYENSVCSGKCGFQCFRTIEIRQNDFVGQLRMLGRIARQRAHFELTARLQRAHNGAALLTGCADDGDELLGVRHGCSPVSGLSLENKIGFRSPSLKPILFDEIHRLWR